MGPMATDEATATEEYSAQNNIVDSIVPIDLDRLEPNPYQPRKHFEEGPLLELAASIREHGLLQPLVVRALGGHPLDVLHDRFQIIAGERRYRACKLVGVTKVPVRILKDCNDDLAARLALVENLQRQDLDPLEEAEGYRDLAKRGMKQREIAEAVKRSQPAIAKRLMLLDLPDTIKERIKSGELTASHGVALAAYKENSRVQVGLAQIAVDDQLPARKLENYFHHVGWLQKPLQDCVYSFGYDTYFDWQKDCRGVCPHNAFRAGQHDNAGYCLRPGCYESKKKAAKAEREARVDKVASKAAVPADGRVLRISKLDRMSYELLGNGVPSGCQEGCPKVAKAIDYNDRTVAICLDPACYRRLKGADTRAENKTGRERAKQLLSELQRRMDALQTVGPREIAVLATLSLNNDWRTKHGIDEALKRQGAVELREPLLGRGYDDQGKPLPNGYEVLSQRTQLELAKAVIETAIRSELHYRYQERVTSSTPIADWYLAEPQAPKAKEIAPTDGKCGRPVEVALLFAMGPVRKTEFYCGEHSTAAKERAEREGWQLQKIDQVSAALRCTVPVEIARAEAPTP